MFSGKEPTVHQERRPESLCYVKMGFLLRHFQAKLVEMWKTQDTKVLFKLSGNIIYTKQRNKIRERDTTAVHDKVIKKIASETDACLTSSELSRTVVFVSARRKLTDYELKGRAIKNKIDKLCNGKLEYNGDKNTCQ